tara:strand:+ start:34 stop:648 length:615 start_codon:yes stop_codon:yes gene_type:complete
MKVLVACEFSGVVRDAFRAKGHDAYSCDIIPCEADESWHHQCDARELLKFDWDLLIAHPPCTYLTNSGVRHLHDHTTIKGGAKAKGLQGSERWVAMYEGAMLFKAFLDADIPRICVENPIPHKYARGYIGKYTQIVQPWQYGHGETKATCLWLKGLPKLEPTNVVDGRESRLHRLPPTEDRAHLRSITFPGIAQAMADQWGDLS